MKFLAFLTLYVCVAAAARPMSRVRSRAPSALEKKAEETCSDHCLSRRDENAKCRHAIFDNDTCPQDSEHEDKMFCCEATDGGNSQCLTGPCKSNPLRFVIGYPPPGGPGPAAGPVGKGE